MSSATARGNTRKADLDQQIAEAAQEIHHRRRALSRTERQAMKKGVRGDVDGLVDDLLEALTEAADLDALARGEDRDPEKTRTVGNLANLDDIARLGGRIHRLAKAIVAAKQLGRLQREYGEALAELKRLRSQAKIENSVRASTAR